MYSERIEALINAALVDGKLTEKEKQILYKNAEAEGIDLDEFEMVLDARLVELEKAKEEATKSAPKSNKLGDVRKCPACGALVNSFHRKCQECGYVFENIQANSIATQLAKLLQEAKDHKARISILSSFPIPSAKGDLMEFIAILRPHVFYNNGDFRHYSFSSTGGGDMESEEERRKREQKEKIEREKTEEGNAYVLKYMECMEKIKLFFPDDEVLNTYVEEVRKMTNKESIMDTFYTIGCTICIGIALVVAYLNDYSEFGFIAISIVGGVIGLGIGGLVGRIVVIIKEKQWAYLAAKKKAD